jgi:hypothetical protein
MQPRAWSSAMRVGAVAVGLLVLPITLAAQGIVGALVGHVTDQDGRPVAGVRVSVAALHLEAQTDVRGDYYLADLPLGTQLVGVVYSEGVGLAVAVQVHAGASGRLDFRLESRPGGGVRTVAVRGPDGMLDPTSRATLSGDVLRALPVDDIRDALRTEAGVVETDAAAGPVVRGGRAGEVVVFLDDVPFRIAAGRAFALGLGTNALAEATLDEGPLAAPYGNTQAGVLNLVTRSTGGSRVSAGFTGATDGMFGDGTRIGFNRLQAFVGGSPLGGVSVFAAATLQGENALPRGAGTADAQAFVPGGVDTTVTEVLPGATRQVPIPAFVQYTGACDPAENFSAACQGRRFPDDWNTAFTMSGRAEWRYAGGSRIGFTYFHDFAQGQTWPGALTFDGAAYTGTRRSGTALVLNWQQRLSGPLTLHAAVSRQSDEVATGVLDPTWAATHRSPGSGIVLSPLELVVDFDHFSSDTGAGAVTQLASDADWERLVTNVITNDGTRLPFLDRSDLRAGQPYRMNPWAVASGVPTQGLETGVPVTTLARRRFWLTRGYAVWHLAARHRLRGGVEIQTSRVDSLNGLLVSQLDMDVYSEAPRQTAVFADYRLTVGSVVMDAGLRWDRFDPNTSFPVVPGRIFTNPNFDPANPTNPADSVYAPARARSLVSPRFRVAYAGIPGTGLRLGIARQDQPPSAATIYSGKNRDLAFASTSAGFGADVELPRSWVVEAGVRRNLGAHVVADVAGYVKTREVDIVSGFRRYTDPLTLGMITLAVPTNIDASWVKGLDASVTARAGAWLDARIGYSLQDWDPFEWQAPSRQHTVASRIGLRGPARAPNSGWLARLVEGGELWIQGRVASGLPYLQSSYIGLGQIAPNVTGGIVEPVLQARTPAIKELDLRIAKRIEVAGLSWSVFGDFRNLLGLHNTPRVFAETGDITNDLYRARFSAPERARLAADAGGRWTTITKSGETLTAVDLRSDCNTWSTGPVDCVLLRRAEARWGDGDGLYDEREQQTALDALYDMLFGPWYFRGPPRHIRLGVEIKL